MKKFFPAILLMAFCTTAFGQDTTRQKNNMGLYTIFVNIIPGDYHFPLLGFINQAQGNHTSLQAGFMNSTRLNFTGAQLGFINTTGKNVTGIQAGFINTGGDSLLGTQAGFVNTIKNSGVGTQLGFTNTAGGYLYGIQAGFLNTVSDSVTGIQAGFVNTGAQQVIGSQLGFVNTTKHLKGMQAGFSNTANVAVGTQIGFVNTSRTVKGFQLGFINVADTVEGGMPFGFLSFVKKGGFTAVEASVTEMYPYNLSFKVGIQKFYTVIAGSFNPEHPNPFAVGAGFGAIFPLSNRFYLNPEALSQNNIGDFTQQNVSFTPYVGFIIMKKLHVVAGPSVVWNCIYDGNEFYKPLFSFSNNELDNKNKIITGLRVGVRYNIKW